MTPLLCRKLTFFVTLTIGVMMSSTSYGGTNFNLKEPCFYFGQGKNCALIETALAGNFEKAGELVAAGANPNDEGPKNNPYNRLRLLHYAIAANNLEAIRVLVSVGADPELDTLGSAGPPFLFTITLMNVKALSLLLDLRPIDSLSEATIRDLLFESVILSRTECLNLLLKHGAPMDFRDKAGYTILMRALDGQNYDLAEHLLLRGASVRIEAKGGMTPAFSVQFELQKFRPGTPPYNKVLHLKKMMEERGAVFPALTPAEVRAKRALDG